MLLAVSLLAACRPCAAEEACSKVNEAELGSEFALKGYFFSE